MDAVDIIRKADDDLDRGKIDMKEFLNRVQPLFDIEPVVRCKYCKYWEDFKVRDEQPSWLPCMAVKTRSDFFCADGVKKDV